MNDLPLASLFPSATEAEWLKRVTETLKGASFEEKLVSQTSDGIRVSPLYGQMAGAAVARGTHGPWTVMQRADISDAAAANAQILEDLAHGVTGIVINIAGAPSARGFGLADAALPTLAMALKDVALHAIAVRLDAGMQGRAAAQNFAALVRQSPVNPELLDVAFGMNPIGVLAQRGYLDDPWRTRAAMMAETIRDLAADFRGPFGEADGRVWHDGGATPAQEIGAVLATGAEYLRAFEALDTEVLGRAIGVTLSADQDMFGTLAKFRAMRLTWGKLFEACGLRAGMRLHAETSWRMMTRLDPHTNILRAVAAVFGAGLGGCDSMAVLPFPLAQGLPDGFARRVARNTQNVLLEESQLWRVDDPAHGAGYVETLTSGIAEKGWGFFQAIEAKGGIIAALEKGWLQGEIAASRARLAEAKAPIIGTSVYRLKEEYAASVTAPAPERPSADPRAITPMRAAEGVES
jgi:methylmalonyl-CoA mutase